MERYVLGVGCSGIENGKAELWASSLELARFWIPDDLRAEPPVDAFGGMISVRRAGGSFLPSCDQIFVPQGKEPPLVEGLFPAVAAIHPVCSLDGVGGCEPLVAVNETFLGMGWVSLNHDARRPYLCGFCWDTGCMGWS